MIPIQSLRRILSSCPAMQISIAVSVWVPGLCYYGNNNRKHYKAALGTSFSPFLSSQRASDHYRALAWRWRDTPQIVVVVDGVVKRGGSSSGEQLACFCNNDLQITIWGNRKPLEFLEKGKGCRLWRFFSLWDAGIILFFMLSFMLSFLELVSQLG